MSKKWLLLAVAVVMAVALAACGGTPSDSGQDTSQPQTGGSTTAGDTTAGDTTATGETTVTGTVTDATMGTTTIKTEDGTELSFGTDSTTMDMKDGLLIGDVVAITYTGEITDSTDTSKATVTKVTDGADNSTNPLRINAASSAANDGTSDGSASGDASSPAAVQ